MILHNIKNLKVFKFKIMNLIILTYIFCFGHILFKMFIIYI